MSPIVYAMWPMKKALKWFWMIDLNSQLREILHTEIQVRMSLIHVTHTGAVSRCQGWPS